MKLSFDAAVQATDAIVRNADRAPAEMRVTTDTRAIERGDLFVALRGERFNGHDYLGEAVAKGASALVVSEERGDQGVATLVVDDTLRAYMALGGAARRRFTGKVLAITGSAGKTTTKVLAAQLLALKYATRVLASPANENNEIGVSKLLLRANSGEHDVLVVEMGARHYGDIVPLVEIAQPNVALLTNVGDAHLEIMGSRERLEETKWGIFLSGASAIVNASDTASIRRAPSLGRPAHWFFEADDGAQIPMHHRVTAMLGNSVIVDIEADRDRKVSTDVRLPGRHNRANLAAAVAASIEFGVRLDDIARAIPDLTLPSGRYERIALSSGVVLIYDAYNANAAGMMAALDTFATEATGRRIALLASMAELGEEAASLHEQVGRHAARTNVDVMLVGGEFAAQLASGAVREGFSSQRIVPFLTNAQAAQWVRDNARSGDAVLLKGSRRYRLEEIVEELRQ